MIRSCRTPTSLLLFSLLAVSSGLRAQPPEPTRPATDLRSEILRADSAMFDAFNAHDLPRLMKWFSKDLEFYHDRGGLQRFDDVAAGFRGLFEKSDGMRRTRLEDGLEVYPIPGFGAVEVGTHRFCHTEGGRDECGTFRFLHVWRKSGDAWQVARVVSYGH